MNVHPLLEWWALGLKKSNFWWIAMVPKKDRLNMHGWKDGLIDIAVLTAHPVEIKANRCL